MTEPGREASAREELERAEEEIQAAEQLLAGHLPRIAVTRAYFAVFHAVRAALYAEGLEPRSHRGALHLFHLHFIRTGRCEPATSTLLARLQKYREEADYGEAFTIDEAGARGELTAATAFVRRHAERSGPAVPPGEG